MDAETPVLEPGKFYGKTRSVHVNGATFSEIYHEKPWRIPAHAHQFAYFGMLLDGEYRELAGNVEIEYEPFTIVYHKPSMRHQDEIGEGGARFFAVELDPEHAALAQAFMHEASLVQVHGGAALWSAIRLYMDFREGTLGGISSESHVFDLIAALDSMQSIDESVDDSAALARVTRRIHEEFSGGISLRELARAENMHPVHLARIFRKQHRRSIGEYVQALKIQAVCRALRSGDEPISNIALANGFADQSHLNRIFKAAIGATPGEYRRSVTEE